MRKQSFGDPEADPWGSPDLHRGHGHSSYTAVPPQTQTNGMGMPAAQTRTTSQFTTHSTSASASVHATPIAEPTPQRPSSYGSEGWGGFGQGAEHNFSNPSLENPSANLI